MTVAKKNIRRKFAVQFSLIFENELDFSVEAADEDEARQLAQEAAEKVALAFSKKPPYDDARISMVALKNVKPELRFKCSWIGSEFLLKKL